MHRITYIAASLALLLTTGSTPALAQRQGSPREDVHLRRALEFANTMLESGVDRYGPKATPAWASMLDVKTRRIPEAKDPNWQRIYDAEDYVRNARGSNLYRDIAGVQAFYALTRQTGDARYKDAADAYLKWFTETCASPSTGLFAWGEHMFYNMVREDLEANRHELEQQLPPWEELWKVNPAAVHRAIEGIYHYHIHDKETFNYDRHGSFYTGKFDDPQVRGPYTKHSGLYAYSFLFLYTKTREPKYLEWALKAGMMFWKVRNPKTNLVSNAWGPQQRGSARTTVQLSWYLLHAFRLDRRQTALRDAAVVMARSYMRAAWDDKAQRFRADVDAADGKPVPHYQGPWGDIQGEAGVMGQTALMAYQETRDVEMLEFARRYAQSMLLSPSLEQVRPLNYAKNVEFLLDLFTETREVAYLRAVRRFLTIAYATLFENGLIKESSDGYIYSAASGAGDLMRAMLQASRVEQDAKLSPSDEDAAPTVHSWTYSKLLRAQDSLGVVARTGGLPLGTKVVLVAEGNVVVEPDRIEEGTYSFTLAPVGVKGVRRGFQLCFNHPGAITWTHCSEPQTAWLVEVGGFEQVQTAGRPLNGVERMAAEALGKDALPNSIPWVFRIPAAAGGERLSVRLTSEEAGPYLPGSLRLYRHEDSGWASVESRYDQRRRVIEAEARPGLYAVSGEPLLKWRLPTDGGILTSPVVAAFAGEKQGLQIALATNDIDRTLHMIGADGSTKWRFPAKGPLSTPALVTAGRKPAVAFSSLDTLYLVSGDGREIWSRSFGGRLSAPAYAGGKIYVASSDGELLVLRVDGQLVWRYSVGASAVTTPVVTDLGEPGAPVILIGCSDAKFRAIREGAGEMWAVNARGGRFLPPSVGDINGDGRPEIVVASKSVSTAHEVMALTDRGVKLWTQEGHREGEWAPVLADMEGLGYKQVIILTELSPWPRCELTILDKLGRRVRGIPIHSRVTMIPVATDLNGDGKLDLVFPCNEGRRMHGMDHSGQPLWSLAPKSYNFAGAKMKGGGRPAIADVDGDGRLEVVVGDDETVLNCIRTETRVPPGTIVNGEFHQSGARSRD